MISGSENRNIGVLLREYSLQGYLVPIVSFMNPPDISNLLVPIELLIIKKDEFS